jgi:predicted aconitase
MKLTHFEKAMLDGEHGEAAQWALDYQRRVGSFFDAEDFVPIRLVHISTDRETIGDSGLAFIREIAELPPADRRPRAFAAADFRGFDADAFRFLLPDRDLAAESDEAALALSRLGISAAHAYVNDHSVTAPTFGESCGYSGTPSVIYMNSFVGARCNFEAGPSSLAAFFTGRVPRYGFHLDRCRRATHAFRLDFTPKHAAEWGAVGALIGHKLNSYWSVPAIEIPAPRPSVLSLNHMALNLASYGSIALCHVIGVTPEAPDWQTVTADRRIETVETITSKLVRDFLANWGGVGERLDVVALSTPQLSITEIAEVAELLAGRKVHRDTALLVYAPLEIKYAAEEMGYAQTIEDAGGRLVHGHDFFATYAKEIRETHDWQRLMTHSVKVANICEGYGYKPTPASIRRCIDSAIAGKVLP